MNKKSIILDAQTVELGAGEMIRGCSLALESVKGSISLVLVGRNVKEMKELADRRLLQQAKKVGANVEFLESKDELPDRIESPVQVYRNYPDNPISKGLRLLKERGGAFISAGNTGLVMTSALFILGRINAVERPPIATPLPTLKKSLFYLDAGANVDLRAHHLHQIAHLGKVYVERIFKRENPRIGLLSNGKEDYKGNAVVREAYKLLRDDESLNFAGYVEGQDLMSGNLDLMVCDGFIGNIILKFAEGIAQTIYRVMKEEMKKDVLSALSAKLFLGSAVRRIKRRLDYSEWGGAPLLGVRGNVVICHGRSGANAIKNALIFALRMINEDISSRLEAEMREHFSVKSPPQLKGEPL